jgi:ATP-dependent exoDNAse (exonuclease V) beta subunit
MACDEDVIPLQERIETVTDESDLEEVYNTERHLLYVACTRARDHLLVTGVDPASEFLGDLTGTHDRREGAVYLDSGETFRESSGKPITGKGGG